MGSPRLACEYGPEAAAAWQGEAKAGCLFMRIRYFLQQMAARGAQFHIRLSVQSRHAQVKVYDFASTSILMMMYSNSGQLPNEVSALTF